MVFKRWNCLLDLVLADILQLPRRATPLAWKRRAMLGSASPGLRSFTTLPMGGPLH